MSILALIAEILAIAEEDILPIFVHNPTSQKITAVVVSTAEAVTAALQQVQTPTPTPPATS